MSYTLTVIRELAAKCPHEYPIVPAWEDHPAVTALAAALRVQGYRHLAMAVCGGISWAWVRQIAVGGDLNMLEIDASASGWSWNQKQTDDVVDTPPNTL